MFTSIEKRLFDQTNFLFSGAAFLRMPLWNFQKSCPLAYKILQMSIFWANSILGQANSLEAGLLHARITAE